MAARCRNPIARRLAVLALVGLAALGAPAHATGVEPVDPVDAGEAVVVDPESPSRVLSRGGSATPFTLDLPEGATCPGDTANDQWRVQTFIIPASDDPGQLLYDGQKPIGDGRWALYRVTSESYNQIETELNEAPGMPALISELPALSLAVFTPDILPPGDYRMGVACAYFREPGPYWDVEVEIRLDESDQPGQLTWEIPHAQRAISEAGAGTSAGPIAAVVAVLLAAVLMLLYLARRRQRLPTTLERSTLP